MLDHKSLSKEDKIDILSQIFITDRDIMWIFYLIKERKHLKMLF